MMRRMMRVDSASASARPRGSAERGWGKRWEKGGNEGEGGGKGDEMRADSASASAPRTKAEGKRCVVGG